MGFFSFLLFIVLVCWIVTLQGKVDSLSSTLKYVCKKLNDLEKLTANGYVSPKVEPKLNEFVEDNKVEEASEKTVASPVPSTSEVKQVNTPKPIYKEVKKDDFDIQKALLGNVFNKIGALAIIIAMVILIKLVSPFIVFTPVMKLFAGIILGFGFLAGGFYLHKKDNMKNYSEVLLGTGFATLFITTFCGYSVLHIYNSVTTLVVGGLLLFATYLFAEKTKTVSMLVIGLIGGYLTPLTSGVKFEELFSFLIFLNALSLVFTLRNKNYRVVNIINLLLSMLVLLGSYAYQPEKNIVYPIILWGIYVLYDLFRVDKTSLLDNAASAINYAILTTFTLVMFHNVHDTLGVLFIVTGVIYLVFAAYSRFVKTFLYKYYEYFVLINIWLYIAIVLNDVQSVISWTIVALVLSVLSGAFRLDYLMPSVVAFYSTAFVGALLAQSAGEYCLITQYAPVVNPRSLVFLVPVVSMLFSSLILRNWKPVSSNWLRFLGVSLGYLYVLGEINSYLLKFGENNDFADFNKFMLFVIVGFIYALNTKKISVVTKSLLFNVASYIIFALTSLFLICGSYWYPEAYLPILNLRFAAYVLAIVACLMYSKWDKTDIYKYFAVFFGFFLVHSESAGIPKLYGEGWQYLISLSWVLYSGLVTIAGIVKNCKYLINSGIVIIVLTIARIFIYDLAKVDALYKLVAFLALGIILMLVSYIYTVNKNKK